MKLAIRQLLGAPKYSRTISYRIVLSVLIAFLVPFSSVVQSSDIIVIIRRSSVRYITHRTTVSDVWHFSSHCVTFYCRYFIVYCQRLRFVTRFSKPMIDLLIDWLTISEFSDCSSVRWTHSPLHQQTSWLRASRARSRTVPEACGKKKSPANRDVAAACKSNEPGQKRTMRRHARADTCVFITPFLNRTHQAPRSHGYRQ